MKHYLLSVYQPEGPKPEPAALQKVMQDVEAFNDKLKAAGVWVFSDGLNSQSTATVLREQSGEIVMTDGPFAEAKEYLGGLTIIKAADLDEALDWGRQCAAATTLPIEVRPFMTES